MNLFQKTLITISFLLVIIAFFVPFQIRKIVDSLINEDDISEKIAIYGTVGDWLGGSTIGLLTFASILLFYSAILIQNKELKLQKEELKATRLEFEEQNRTLASQKFDSTFFNMIELHNSIVEGIEFQKFRSRKSLDKAWVSFDFQLLNSLRAKYSSGAGKVNNMEIPIKDFLTEYSNRDTIIEVFEKFYDENEPILGHYFRNMYRIIKFIDESDLKKEEKSNYRGIFRAQLSSSELYLLFYNINFSSKGKRFRELLLNTDFFKDHLGALIKNDVALSRVNNECYNELLSK